MAEFDVLRRYRPLAGRPTPEYVEPEPLAASLIERRSAEEERGQAATVTL